jgi:hypothetical protein
MGGQRRDHVIAAVAVDVVRIHLRTPVPNWNA